MLNCSIGYAQKANPKSTKKPKAPSTKVIKDTPLVNVKADTVPQWMTDTVYIDPLDTAYSVRISKSAPDKGGKYTARDSMPYDAVNRVLYLYGDASVDFGDMNLKAEQIKIEFEKNLVIAYGIKDSMGIFKGKPVFKQGGSEYKAELIKYNLKSKKGYLSNIITKEGEGYVHGSDVIRNEENNFGVKNAKYTTCEDEHPHYFIGALKIKVIPNKKIITGPANLWIADVPTILAVPFGIFPLKKGQSSGLIIPQYGNSLDRGYFLRNGGYYFALGDHHDLQLTGDIYSNTSWAGRGMYRYTTKYRFSGNLALNLAYNKFGNEEDPDFRKSNDFQLSWLHRVDPKARPYTNFSANVNIASSSYLANNSYVAQNIVTNQLNSSISFSKGSRSGRYNFSTNARMSQNTRTRDVSVSLPDMTFSVSSFAPFKPAYKNTADKWYENITTNYIVQFRNELNTKDSILFQNWGGESRSNLQKFLDTATRYGMYHSIPVQTSFKLFKYYTLSAGVSFNDYMYFKTIRKDTFNNSVRNINEFGFENALTYSTRLGLSTRYYGMAQFTKGGLKAIRHVITPTVDFTYVPDFGDSKYGYYRTYKNSAGQDVKYSIFESGIYGGPGSGKQGNIGFAIDNNLELKIKPAKSDTTKTDRKIQIFESIRASAYYNMFADSMNLSTISISGRTRIFKNISINGSAQLDPYINLTEGATGSRYIRRINKFYLNEKQYAGVITNANVGVSAGFNPQMFGKKTTHRPGYEGELRYMNDFPGDYYDFSIPWSFNVNYTITYNKYANLNSTEISKYIQTMNFNGDINLTKNWKIGYSSGYDIQNNELTFTSVDFIRNIHCWEFKLNWIPIGSRQSFLFTINVKSSLLQDLKMTRRRDWYDRIL